MTFQSTYNVNEFSFPGKTSLDPSFGDSCPAAKTSAAGRRRPEMLSKDMRTEYTRWISSWTDGRGRTDRRVSFEPIDEKEQQEASERAREGEDQASSYNHALSLIAYSQVTKAPVILTTRAIP